MEKNNLRKTIICAILIVSSQQIDAKYQWLTTLTSHINGFYAGLKETIQKHQTITYVTSGLILLGISAGIYHSCVKTSPTRERMKKFDPLWQRIVKIYQAQKASLPVDQSLSLNDNDIDALAQIFEKISPKTDAAIIEKLSYNFLALKDLLLNVTDSAPDLVYTFIQNESLTNALFLQDKQDKKDFYSRLLIHSTMYATMYIKPKLALLLLKQGAPVIEDKNFFPKSLLEELFREKNNKFTQSAYTSKALLIHASRSNNTTAQEYERDMIVLIKELEKNGAKLLQQCDREHLLCNAGSEIIKLYLSRLSTETINKIDFTPILDNRESHKILPLLLRKEVNWKLVIECLNHDTYLADRRRRALLATLIKLGDPLIATFIYRKYVQQKNKLNLVKKYYIRALQRLFDQPITFSDEIIKDKTVIDKATRKLHKSENFTTSEKTVPTLQNFLSCLAKVAKEMAEIIETDPETALNKKELARLKLSAKKFSTASELLPEKLGAKHLKKCGYYNKETKEFFTPGAMALVGKNRKPADPDINIICKYEK